MPQLKSIKFIIVEATIAVLIMAAVGHLSVNFWERILLQNELSRMKESLHFLKKTLNDIGIAYDKLNNEVKGISNVTDMKNSLMNYIITSPDLDESTKIMTLDCQRQDIQFNAMVDPTNFLQKTNAKHEGVNFPSKENTKDEGNNFPSKESTKDESINYPSEADTRYEPIHVKDEAVNFPPKTNAKSETFNFQPNHLRDRGSNIPSKVNKTTDKTQVETKSPAIFSARANLSTFTRVMKKFPLNPTGAGRGNKKVQEKICDCGNQIGHNDYYNDPYQHNKHFNRAV